MIFKSEYFKPSRLVYLDFLPALEAIQKPASEIKKEPKITDGETIEITKVDLEELDQGVVENLKQKAEKCMEGTKDQVRNCLKEIQAGMPWRERNVIIATALGIDVKDRSEAYVKAIIESVQRRVFKELDLHDRRAKCDGKCGDYTTLAMEIYYDIKSNINPDDLKGIGELKAVRFMEDLKAQEKQKAALLYTAYEKILSVGLNDHMFNLIKEPLMAAIDMKQIDNPKYLLGLIYKIKHDGLDSEDFFDMVLGTEEKAKARAYAELFLIKSEAPETLVS